ncbi:MAG: SBBP repeat-containing protein [Candidatus Cloacimonadota bacterium]|jgi:hypothetical protein|nr:SBBP repeat-containing protein [Candidatus Cloacimonadota bacterium]OQC10442.1 MAG: Beta-propeller repeat protein [Candidatus Cloacimonetes bacterium ADurb.Bin088]
MKATNSLILCLILLCGAAVLEAQSPQWQWAVAAGNIGYYYGNQIYGSPIAVDSLGNQYVTGDFVGTANFGSQTLTARGCADIFVAKLDPAGNWLWTVQAGGLSDDCGYGIAVDGSGNIYVTGAFQKTAYFGSNTLTANGNTWISDVFVAKLDPYGNWLWVAQAGGSEFDEGFDIDLDDAGNACVIGFFQDTATFGSHTLTVNGGEYVSSIFVAKLDPSGNWLWAVQAEGTSYKRGNGIALDEANNAWVTGCFAGTATFGSHTLTANGNTYYEDIFVAKLDPSGNWLWAVQAGGSDNDAGLSIALDRAGNACVTGFFQDTATFGSYILATEGWDLDTDIFVAKLDTYGNWLWAVQVEGGEQPDYGFGIAMDSAGNSYVTGLYMGTANFGSHTLEMCGCNDFFAAKLDSNGNWIWAVNAEGQDEDYGHGIALDCADNAYVCGFFRDTVNFGSHSLTAIGDLDIFIAKLENVTPVEDVLAPPTLARLHNAYPNPLSRSGSALIKAEIPERSNGTLSIFNLRGQMVACHKLGSGSQQITFSGEGLPSGVYLYSLQCGDYRETRKLVLMK